MLVYLGYRDCGARVPGSRASAEEFLQLVLRRYLALGDYLAINDEAGRHEDAHGGELLEFGHFLDIGGDVEFRQSVNDPLFEFLAAGTAGTENLDIHLSSSI